MLGRVVKLFRDNRGFTLIEMIVVVIILGLLAGLVAPKLFGRVGQSKQVAARTQIELLGAALDQYSLDMGSYPTSLDALIQSPGGGGNWNGPYLKKNAVPADPWGNPYNYKCCPGEHGDYDLWSDGADGRPGGTGENADVASWTIK
jgi:general secretion pathway protein G